jgi:hypothetical protein
VITSAGSLPTLAKSWHHSISLLSKVKKNVTIKEIRVRMIITTAKNLTPFNMSPPKHLVKAILSTNVEYCFPLYHAKDTE